MRARTQTIACGALLAILSAAALSAAPPSLQQKGFLTWLQGKVGLRRSAYNNLARVRNGPRAVAGARLVRYSLTTDRESPLSECDGCWSPLVIDRERIVVLREDGVWEVSLSGRPFRRLVVAAGLRSLVARYDTIPTQLVALQDAVTCGDTAARVRVVDLRLARIGAAPDSLDECVPPVAAVNVDRVRNGRALTTTDPGSDGYTQPRSVKVGHFAAASDTLLSYYALSRRLDASPDGLDRFDPVWLNDSTVVYVVRRL